MDPAVIYAVWAAVSVLWTVVFVGRVLQRRSNQRWQARLKAEADASYGEFVPPPA